LELKDSLYAPELIGDFEIVYLLLWLGVSVLLVETLL